MRVNAGKFEAESGRVLPGACLHRSTRFSGATCDLLLIGNDCAHIGRSHANWARSNRSISSSCVGLRNCPRSSFCWSTSGLCQAAESLLVSPSLLTVPTVWAQLLLRRSRQPPSKEWHLDGSHSVES